MENVIIVANAPNISGGTLYAYRTENDGRLTALNPGGLSVNETSAQFYNNGGFCVTQRNNQLFVYFSGGGGSKIYCYSFSGTQFQQLSVTDIPLTARDEVIRRIIWDEGRQILYACSSVDKIFSFSLNSFGIPTPLANIIVFDDPDDHQIEDIALNRNGDTLYVVQDAFGAIQSVKTNDGNFDGEAQKVGQLDSSDGIYLSGTAITVQDGYVYVAGQSPSHRKFTINSFSITESGTLKFIQRSDIDDRYNATYLNMDLTGTRLYACGGNYETWYCYIMTGDGHFERGPNPPNTSDMCNCAFVRFS
jgi:hypothetical protein